MPYKTGSVAEAVESEQFCLCESQNCLQFCIYFVIYLLFGSSGGQVPQQREPLLVWSSVCSLSAFLLLYCFIRLFLIIFHCCWRILKYFLWMKSDYLCQLNLFCNVGIICTKKWSTHSGSELCILHRWAQVKLPVFHYCSDWVYMWYYWIFKVEHNLNYCLFDRMQNLLMRKYV